MNKVTIKSISLSILGLIAMLLFLKACQKPKAVEPKPPQPKSEPQPVAQQTDSTATVLGKKLKNPYAVSNMRKAFEKVQADTAEGLIQVGDIPAFSTPVSHLYLKFMPKTQAELDILLADSNLILYEYPLDYEIEQLGSYYRDSTIPDDQPTPQYCAVSVDYTLPAGVEYEVLEPLFIPEEVYEEEWNNAVLTATDTLVDRLVGHAMVLTGHIPSDTSGELRDRKICFWNCFPKWRPKGRIRVWDNSVDSITITRSVRVGTETYQECHKERSDGGRDHMRWICTDHVRPVTEPRKVRVAVNGSWVGVEGVEVRARRWFRTVKGITDADGKYSCNGRFERSANYSIQWKRYQFKITNGLPDWTIGNVLTAGLLNRLSQASFNGPKKTGDWNLDISNGSTAQLHATVFRAAYHYYYKNILGLKRPPQNSGRTPQMKIAVRNKAKSGKSGHFFKDSRLFKGVYSIIKIWNNGGSNAFIYGTTIHELAHASHWELRKRWWNNGRTSDKLIESWADGVEWALTRTVYPNYTDPADRTFLRMRTTGKGKYTSLITDLIDTTNQGRTDTRFPLDRVTGYTIAEIEAVLKNCKNIRDLRDQLLRHYDKPTDPFLNELIEQYISLRRKSPDKSPVDNEDQM